MYRKNGNRQQELVPYPIKDFVPLLILLAGIILFTAVRRIIAGYDFSEAMADFMGSFFLVFGLFKVVSLNGFVQAFSRYDLIAQRFLLYAYAYPFIELVLGCAYMMRYKLFVINSVTLVIMLIGAAGVARALAKTEKITCACLGAVFKIPMTYITLFEDLLMAGMAALMLVR